MAGWKIPLGALPALIGIEALIVAAHGTGPRDVAIAVRTSALVAFAIFLLPFTASAMHTLRPGPATKWIRRNRRYLGIAFAFAMAVHIAFVIWLFAISPKAPAPAIVIVLGGIGYIIIAALFATSFDATADWLGPVRWRVLHLTGVWYLWTIFVLVFLSSFVFAPRLFTLLLLIAFSAAAMRAIARRSRSSARTSGAKPVPIRGPALDRQA